MFYVRMNVGDIFEGNQKWFMNNVVNAPKEEKNKFWSIQKKKKKKKNRARECGVLTGEPVCHSPPPKQSRKSLNSSPNCESMRSVDELSSDKTSYTAA